MILGGRDPSGAYTGVEWLYKEGSGMPGPEELDPTNPHALMAAAAEAGALTMTV